MTYLLLGLLIGVIAAGLFGFERQRQVYDQLVRVMENDRDAARQEAKVFRSLLFPSITRAEENLGDVRAVSSAQISGEGSQSTARTAPKGTSARIRARVSTRQWFNQMRKQANTPQIKTDALAAAIAHVNAQQQDPQKVPSQEKTHA